MEFPYWGSIHQTKTCLHHSPCIESSRHSKPFIVEVDVPEVSIGPFCARVLAVYVTFNGLLSQKTHYHCWHWKSGGIGWREQFICLQFMWSIKTWNASCLNPQQSIWAFFFACFDFMLYYIEQSQKTRNSSSRCYFIELTEKDHHTILLSSCVPTALTWDINKLIVHLLPCHVLVECAVSLCQFSLWIWFGSVLHSLSMWPCLWHILELQLKQFCHFVFF